MVTFGACWQLAQRNGGDSVRATEQLASVWQWCLCNVSYTTSRLCADIQFKLKNYNKLQLQNMHVWNSSTKRTLIGYGREHGSKLAPHVSLVWRVHDAKLNQWLSGSSSLICRHNKWYKSSHTKKPNKQQTKQKRYFSNPYMKMLTGAQDQTILRSNHICVKSPVGSSDRVFTLNWFHMSRRTAALTSALLHVFFIFSTKVLLLNPNPPRVGLHSNLLRLCFTLPTYWLQWPTQWCWWVYYTHL